MSDWRTLPMARFTLTVEGVGGKLSVLSFTGTQRLSELYRFTIEVAWKDEAPLLRDLLDGKACLRIEQAGDYEFDPVEVRGVISEAESHGMNEDRTALLVTLELRPRLWLATRSRRSRLFIGANEEQTIVDVINAVMRTYGFQPGTDYQLDLTASDYPKRPYVVQHDESDFDFLARWLEHEGIAFAYETTAQGDKPVFFDKKDSYEPFVANDHQLHFRPLASGDDTGDWKVAWSLRHAVRRIPKHLVMQDYNWRDNVWRDPAGSLRVSKPTNAGKSGAAPTDWEKAPQIHHDTASHYGTRAEGTFLAGRRAEAIDASEEQLEGETAGVHFRPGVQLEALDGARAGVPAGNWVLVAVEHHGAVPKGSLDAGTTASYGNRFAAIPAARMWRPLRRTPWPAIRGVMHGVVDGNTCDHDAAENDETNPYAIAEVNARGEYRVRLPYDLADREKGAVASCWMRMAQPLTGEDFGLHFPLHVGTEVMIAHIDGDPDRPVIVGAVHNQHALNPVHQGNSHKNVLRTASGNRLELDDQYNGQRIYLENSKSTAFDMLGRDFTQAASRKSTPSAQNAAPAAGGAPAAPAGRGSSQFAAAPAAPAAPVAARSAPSSHFTEEEPQHWDAAAYPDPRFWDWATASHQVTGLDLGSEPATYVAADFKTLFKVVDREKYKPTWSAVAHANHTKRLADFEPGAIAAKRQDKTLAEKLQYVAADGDLTDPAFCCYRFTGTIGWQRLNVGPEVSLQYGRVHRKHQGDGFEHRVGDDVFVRESGARYEFLAKTDIHVWGEGNRFRYGGGFESRDALKQDVTGERFASYDFAQHLAHHRKVVDGSKLHQHVIASECVERAVSAKHVADYVEAANVALTWIKAPKAFAVVEGDRLEHATGDAWVHSDKNQLHTATTSWTLKAGKILVESEGAHATKADKVQITASTLVLKQSPGSAGGSPGSGSKGGAAGLKGKPAGLISSAADLVSAAGAQKGDGTAALDGSPEAAPSTAVTAGSPSVSGSGLLIDAVQAEIKTSAALKIKAGATCDIEATATMKLKSNAPLTVESSAIVMIKGSLIQLG